VTAVLRRLGEPGGEYAVEIDADSWDLDTQIASCTRWLRENQVPTGASDLVLDIGFQARPEVAIAGYSVPLDFMRCLCERNIHLWLSLYPGECEAPGIPPQ
jgi:hypothetical protein